MEHGAAAAVSVRAVAAPPIEPRDYEGLIAFDQLVALVRQAVTAGQLDGDAGLIAVGLRATMHGITSRFIARAAEPIALCWPDVRALVDHCAEVHLARRPATRLA